jgi:hypothetical protein
VKTLTRGHFSKSLGPLKVERFGRRLRRRGSLPK